MSTEDTEGLALVPASDEDFYRRGRDWEKDREVQASQVSALGWKLFYGAGIFCVLLLIAVIVLVLRHRPLGFMVTVDKATGETSTILPVDESRLNLGEIEVKHDIKRYVQARESYYYPLLQRDYNLVLNMSCNDPEHPVAEEYDKRFGGDKGLDKVLGSGTEWRVEVLSIRLPQDEPGKAVVSFEKTVYHGLQPDQNIKPTRNVVTMTYKNELSMLAKESVWIDNPRGFKACAYRVDPELRGGAN